MLLASPDADAASGLYYTDPDYDRLQTLLGGPDLPAGAPQPPGATGSPYVTATWLIHDIYVWRMDRIFLAGDDVWVVSETSGDGGPLTGDGMYPGQTGGAGAVWHRPTDPAALATLLIAHGLTPGPAAAAPTQPAAPVPIGTGWLWGIRGLLGGLLLGGALPGRDESPDCSWTRAGITPGPGADAADRLIGWRAERGRRHHGEMFIAGTERWKVVLVEPEALRIALYVRDAAGLDPVTDPSIPPADPSTGWWPAWSRRPMEAPQSRGVRLLGRRGVDLTAASTQWARWWPHLLDRGPAGIDDLRPPNFPALAHVPDLRAVLQQHYHNACTWSEGLNGDPRIRNAHSAPGIGLNTFIKDLPRRLGREPGRFALRVTVIGVQGKHAWVLRPDHFLLTRSLMYDLDNALDWLRPRILAIA